MQPLKPLDQLAPRGRRRIANLAEKLGLSIEEVRTKPELSKQARGHSASEGHGSVQKIDKSGHRIEQVRAGRKDGKRGTVESEEPPTIADIRTAFRATAPAVPSDTDKVMVRVGGYFDEPQLKRIGSPRARHVDETPEQEMEEYQLRYVSAVLTRKEAREILYEKGLDVQDRMKLLLGPGYNSTLVEGLEITFANS